MIAPYATALAAMVDRGGRGARTSRGCSQPAALGHYGWYEALDYTPSRVPEGENVAVVRAYMAHHQGMTLVAIADALHGGAMRARFHAEPIIQATELLLQERTPRDVAVAHPRAEEVKADANVRESVPPTIRRFHSPHDLIPRTHLLIQRQLHRDDHRGRLGLQPLARDGGHAMARRRHLRFVGNLHLPSGCAERQGLVCRFPAGGVEADSYEVEFSEDRGGNRRRDGTMTTTLEVAVSPRTTPRCGVYR